MSKRRRLGSEDGWVLVPVIILMVVAIGVGTALLTIVDTQTQQSGKQRKVDSAQTLAEGAVSATANVLAVDNSASMWPVSGLCATVSGDLTNPSTRAERVARREDHGGGPGAVLRHLTRLCAPRRHATRPGASTSVRYRAASRAGRRRS